MSDTYTKLFRSIAASTIVSEPLATRWLWVTMLSQADKAGKVYASVPGLARMANISLEECEAGLACFLAPDKYSRTSDHDGRRIEAFDGGWVLLNHAKYDAMRNDAERREKKREWDRANRPSGHQRAKAQANDGTGQSESSPSQSDENRQSGPISHISFPNSSTDTEIHTPPAAVGGLEGSFEGHDDKPSPGPTPAGMCAVALNRAGFQITSINPTLLAYLSEGGSLDHLLQLTTQHQFKGKGAGYLLAAARRELTAPAPTVAQGGKGIASPPVRIQTAKEALAGAKPDPSKQTAAGPRLALDALKEAGLLRGQQT